MTLLGLPLAWLVAIFAAASALIVALHLDRTRPTILTVSTLDLWQQLLRQAGQTRHQQQRLRLGAMGLCLAIAACLSLALGDPSFTGRSHEERLTLLAIDAGATMTSRDGNHARLDTAVEAARLQLAHLQPGERVLLLAAGPVMRPLTGFLSDQKVLNSALENVAAMQGPSNPEALQRYATDLLSGHKHPRLILVSDGGLLSAPAAWSTLLPNAEVVPVPVGDAAPNLAITAFGARRDVWDRDNAEVWLKVENSAARPAQATLSLLDGQREVYSRTLDLAAHDAQSLSMPSVLVTTGRLTAKLKAKDPTADALALDSVAYAAVPPHKPLAVLLVTSGNGFLVAALTADPLLQVQVLSPSDYPNYLTANPFDVVVFDSVVPDAAPTLPAFYIHPEGVGPGAPLNVLGTLHQPGFDRLRADEPLVRATALRDTNIGQALQLAVEPQDIVAAAAAGGPLLVRGQRHGLPFVALAFRLADSDLPLRAAFPVLVHNALAFLTGVSRDYLDSQATYHRISLPADAKPTPVKGPDGEIASHVDSNKVWFTPQTAGFYYFSENDRAVSVNYQPHSPALGRVSEKDPWQHSPHSPPQATQVPKPIFAQAKKQPWQLLVALALMLLAGEWLLAHRRQAQ